MSEGIIMEDKYPLVDWGILQLVHEYLLSKSCTTCLSNDLPWVRPSWLIS